MVFVGSNCVPGFLATAGAGLESGSEAPAWDVVEVLDSQPIEAMERADKTRTEAKLLMVALSGSRRRGEPCPMTKHATPRKESSSFYAGDRRMQRAGRSVLVRADDFAPCPSNQVDH